MSKTIRYSLYLLAAITTLSVFYYVASFWSSCPPCYGISNADMLYASSLAHNLIYEKGSLWDWLMPTTPFIFPDIILSLIINSFTSNILLSIPIYAAIQLWYFLFIILILLKQVTENRINFFFILVYILTILLMAKEISHQANLELLVGVFQSADHFGSFIMILTCLYFFIRYWQNPKKIFLVLFLFLSIISFTSDVLVGFYLLIPLLITISLSILSKLIPIKMGLKLLIMVMIATLCGYLSYRFLPLYFQRENTLIHYKYGLISFWLIMRNFFHSSPEIFLLWLSFIIFSPISLIKTALDRKRNQEDSTLRPLNFLLIWQVVMIFVMIPIFIITDTHLHEAKEGTYMGLRHLQPVILAPVFIGLPLLIYKHLNVEKLFWKVPVCIGFLILILFASWNHPPFEIKNFSPYYPAEIACLDEAIKKYHLHNGLANYWDARPLAVFNKSGARIVAINVDLTPSLLSGTVQYYKKGNFDFIVSQSSFMSINTDFLMKNLGQSTATFTCPGGYVFLVYSEHQLDFLFKNLKHPCQKYRCE